MHLRSLLFAVLVSSTLLWLTAAPIAPMTASQSEQGRLA